MGIKRILIGLGLIGAIAAAPAAMPAPAVGNDADKAAIARILDAEGAAWAKGDAQAFAASATPGIVFTNIVGMFSVGKAPFVAQHAHIFATIYKGSVMRQAIEDLTFIDPTTAIVSTVSKLTGVAQFPPGVVPVDGVLYTRLQQVMIRRPGGWQVAAFHNVVIQPQFVDEAMQARFAD